MLNRSLIYSLLLLSTCTVFADQWDYYLSKKCEVFPKQSVKYEPLEFNSSNNLVRDVGGNFYTKGKIFILTGKLLDSSCVPISDARINIWHADSNGFLQNPTEPMEGKSQNYFQLNGTTNTNNLGIFNFVTLIPNYFLKKNGEIYLKAYIEGLGEFYHVVNINENMLQKNNLKELHPSYIGADNDEFKQYKFQWALDVHNTFLKY